MKSTIILSDSWIDANRIVIENTIYNGIGFKQIKNSKIQVPKQNRSIQYYSYEEFCENFKELFPQIKCNELFFEVQLGSVSLDKTLGVIMRYTDVEKIYLIKNMPIYELLEDFQKQYPENQQFYKKTREKKELELSFFFEKKGIPFFIFKDVEQFYEKREKGIPPRE
jgi:hypothetical protein